MHHGTILYDFDLPKVEEYLCMPKDIPEYREGRVHMDFISNAPLAANDIKNALKDVFGVSRLEGELSDVERECLRSFRSSKEVFVKLP